MEKKPRGNISVRGTTYQRIQEHCKSTGASVSGFLEQIIEADLDARGAPKAPETPRLDS